MLRNVGGGLAALRQHRHLPVLPAFAFGPRAAMLPSISSRQRAMGERIDPGDTRRVYKHETCEVPGVLMRRLAGLALGLAAGSQVAADVHPNNRFSVYLGALQATVDSSIAINGRFLPPVPPVDVEGVLGVERSKTVPWGGIAWQIANRHAIEAEFFTLTRRAETTDVFEPPLQIGDTILESGTVATTYETDVYRLTYGFSLRRDERSDLQLKAGLHVANLSAGFGLDGAICNPETIPARPPGCPNIGAVSDSEAVSAPLPHFGIAYAFALAPEWTLNAAGMGFALEVNNIDGSIIEADVDIVWQPLQHFGIGAGYRYFDVNVGSGTSGLNGTFEFEYHGPTLYLQATF
jgi:hypothetical protein